MPVFFVSWFVANVCSKKKSWWWRNVVEPEMILLFKMGNLKQKRCNQNNWNLKLRLKIDNDLPPFQCRPANPRRYHLGGFIALLVITLKVILQDTSMGWSLVRWETDINKVLDRETSKCSSNSNATMFCFCERAISNKPVTVLLWCLTAGLFSSHIHQISVS